MYQFTGADYPCNKKDNDSICFESVDSGYGYDCTITYCKKQGSKKLQLLVPINISAKKRTPVVFADVKHRGIAKLETAGSKTILVYERPISDLFGYRRKEKSIRWLITDSLDSLNSIYQKLQTNLSRKGEAYN